MLNDGELVPTRGYGWGYNNAGCLGSDLCQGW
jgi:hypothetical protein